MKYLIALMFMLVVACAWAGDKCYVDIDVATTNAVSCYVVTNAPDRVEWTTGYVRLEITKSEYQKIEQLAPNKALKQIDKAKIAAALSAATNEVASWSAAKQEIHEIEKAETKKRAAALAAELKAMGIKQ
jgi:hypothetical protein